MNTRRMVKVFEFNEEERSALVFAAGTRLDPTANTIQLAPDSSGNFVTDSTQEMFVRSRLTNPKAVKQWLGFQAEDIQKKDVTQTVVTSCSYRLSDGVTDFWWNGSNWVPAPVGSWNTEADVARFISVFPAAAKALQVVARLSTTDPTQTPEVGRVKVLYSAVINFQEDLVLRTLIPLLRANIRPMSDYPFNVKADTTVLDIKNTHPLDTRYTIVSIDSVFNHTVDPTHDNDLLVAFDPVTQVITLDATILRGQQAWVRFVYQPNVGMTTSQDYTDIQKVPEIIIMDVSAQDMTELTGAESVINKATGDAVIIPAPTRGDIEFTMQGICDKAVDQIRLADEVKRFFANNPVIRSTGLDDGYRLWLIDEYNMTADADQRELQFGQARARIVGALVWTKDAKDVRVVKRLNLTGDLNTVIE